MRFDEADVHQNIMCITEFESISNPSGENLKGLPFPTALCKDT